MFHAPALEQHNIAAAPADGAEKQLKETVWLNGEYLPLEEARVSVEDRALQFGDGIYEVLLAIDGVPLLAEEHLDRWEISAAGLSMSARFTREQRLQVIHELARRLGARRAAIYGQLSRGTARQIGRASCRERVYCEV